MLENGKPATPEVVKHIDRCLSCLSCMTTCPSGVHYMHLVDHARAYIEETYTRPWHDRLMRSAACRASCPIPNRFRARAHARRAIAGRSRSRRACRRAAAARHPPARHDRAGAGGAGRARRFDGPGDASAGGGARRAASRILVGLRPAGAQARHQRGHHPPAEPPWRRGRAAERRGLLRRARPSHGPRGRDATRFAKRNIDAWIAEMDGRGARRHRHHRLGLRHHDQGLRLHVPQRPGLCREGGAGVGARQGHHRIPRDLELWRRCARPDSRSPITPPARCSTASRSAPSRRPCCAGGLHGQGRAGGAYLLRLGRHLQHPAAGDRRRSCATARSPISSAPQPGPRSRPAISAA